MKNLIPNMFLGTFPLVLFGYSFLAHRKVEETIYEKYLGNVTMDGLKELLAGGEMSPHMLI